MSLASCDRIWFFSYWTFVIPLTLLSAYLLLSKPRSSASERSTESISADVFSRWQRKTGFVSLMLACVLMGGWVRSFYFSDRFGISEELNSRLHFCESLNGSIRWICFKLPDPFAETEEGSDDDEETNADVDATEPTYSGWQVKSRSKEPLHFVPDDSPDSGFRLKFRFMGFGSGDLVSIDGAKSVPGTIWFIPYWSIVLPLTLFSAFLLFSKPNKSPPKKNAETMANEGM